jgi:hypothetical protein
MDRFFCRLGGLYSGRQFNVAMAATSPRSIDLNQMSEAKLRQAIAPVLNFTRIGKADQIYPMDLS